MKKLGKNIKIGFFNYEVIYPYSFREVSKSAGQCDYIDQEIRIMGSPVNEDKVDDRVVSVLVHELIHAIGYVSGHPVFQNQDEQDDENAIDGWSEHLCMLLRENRWFL